MNIPTIHPPRSGSTSALESSNRGYQLPKQLDFGIRSTAGANSLKGASPSNMRLGQSSAAGGTRSQRPSLYAQVAQAGSTLSSVAAAASDQRRKDKEAGIGLFEGAGQFADAIVRGSVELSETGLEKIGSAGRASILMSFAKELKTAVSAVDAAAAASTEVAAASAATSAETAAARTTVAAGGAAAAAEGTVLASAAGGLLPFAGAVYSGYQLISNWGNINSATGALNGAAIGAYVGSVIPGLGTLAGGLAGGLLGAAAGLFHKSGKHADQLVRDQIRNVLQNAGLLDAKFGIALGDGSRFDLGKDGGATLKNLDGTTRHYYDTDPSNPLSAAAVGLVNPLAHLIASGDPKASSDLAGMLANAALSNAKSLEDVRKNVLSFITALKVSQDGLNSAVKAYAQQGAFGTDEAAAYLNGVNTLFDTELLKQQNSGL